MTKQEFLNTIAGLVRAENLRRGNPLFNSVVIAQAICESGWGQSEIMMKANAVFGIKATSNWKGKVYNANTKECYDGVNYTNINACFRAYNSLEESVKDYFDLITTSPRYRKACVTSTPLECITEIKNGGYATSPTYIQTIMSIINGSNLTKYDVSQETLKYNVGKNYTLQDNMFVRTGAGTSYSIKAVRELTEDGKRHALVQDLNSNAILKKGTIVTCLEVIKEGLNIWLRIPSGYVAGFHNGTEFIK